MNKVRESFERELATEEQYLSYNWESIAKWLAQFDNMDIVPMEKKEPEIEARYTQNNFLKQLTDLINCCSQEIGSNTPDFLLAEYLLSCLNAFNVITTRRDKWYRR